MSSKSNSAFTTCLEHPGLVSACAEAIAGCEHLLTEILIRLPTKSLMKFKSVSKHWNFLISAPYFSLLHMLHNPKDSMPISGIFLRRRCVLSPYAYWFLPVTDSNISLPSFSETSSSTFEIPALAGLVVSILQSCNGLLLYYSISLSNSQVLNLHVCNPITSQLRTIPNIQNSFLSATLAFDPHSLSYGYKIVSVHTSASPDHYALKVYSSETGCWKDVDEISIRVLNDMALRNGVYWRGSIHWVCSSGESLYLEVDKERVAKMPSPVFSRPERGNMKCFECKGKLWCLWHEYSDMTLEVHMLDNYEEGWLLKFTLNLGVVRKASCLSGAYHPEFAVLSLIISRKCNGGEKCMMVVIHVPGKILGYDLVEGTIKEMCKIPLIEGEAPGERQFYCGDAYLYCYSLACV
ncbi:F-box protein At5g07610-like [Chenopodium quinoa]|uniref:F-box protein At5g07610-like n=1 Tax=Chenopodium quinoa TaxID=63459 RepID=UPI000B78764E|nr:F-box protein At5g07610-like [Chenopodium quinoa]